MMDANAAITYMADYDPYGAPIGIYNNSAVTSALGFTGEQTDPSGLQYLRARYYNPATGTFLSADPAMGAYPTLSASWNGYGYAHGNPVMYSDPSGEVVWLALAIGAAWFARGAAVDVGMQIVLEGRGFDNLDLGRAAISGGIDVVTGGLGTLAKGAGYAARTINRLDFAVDIALSAASDVAFYNQDPLTALAGNTLFGGAGRVGFHQLGRGLNAAAPHIARGAKYADTQLLRLGSWYSRNFDLSAVGSGPFPILRHLPDDLPAWMYHDAVTRPNTYSDPSYYEAFLEKAVHRPTSYLDLPSRPDVPVYSVIFEARLTRDVHYPTPGNPGPHFREANRQLYRAVRSDRNFARAINDMYPGIIDDIVPGSRGGFSSRSRLAGVLVWHHNPHEPGLMQLIPVSHHQATGSVQTVLHPNGIGGMEKWGGGY